MIKNILLLVLIAAVLSCNNAADKASGIEEEKMINTDITSRDKDLIYLDTARDMNNILAQGWVMADDAEALEGMDENSKFEIPYRSFYFSPDGSLVKNPRNALDHGTWKFDEASKTLYINTVIERDRNVYKIARLTPDEMILVNTGIGSATNLKFISQAVRFKNAADEPFYIENNRWRIKPKAPETDSLIHQRVKAHIHFFILYYKSLLAKKDAYVSFWGLPSCYKWYGGGLSLKKEADLKKNWMGCFYNKEQGMKAYAIADRLMDQKYNWPKGEQNWLKLNLAVLEQMYEKIDEVR